MRTTRTKMEKLLGILRSDGNLMFEINPSLNLTKFYHNHTKTINHDNSFVRKK